MAKKQEDQSRKIVLKRGLGETPEDPVCDSGIFCYGKPLFIFYNVNHISEELHFNVCIATQIMYGVCIVYMYLSMKSDL